MPVGGPRSGRLPELELTIYYFRAFRRKRQLDREGRAEGDEIPVPKERRRHSPKSASPAPLNEAGLE